MSKISFAEHTLGEVIGIAIGMGLPVPPRDRVRRGALEGDIQRAHDAACRREAHADGGPGERRRQEQLRRVVR